VVLFGLLALRARSSQRHRRGQSPTSAQTSPFTDPTSTSQASDSVDDWTGKVTFTGIAPGWLTDPTGRHEKRYWSGSEWTEHVTDGGVPGTDPPPDHSNRESPS
jgi:Protein of unknown function (DUF2510)